VTGPGVNLGKKLENKPQPRKRVRPIRHTLNTAEINCSATYKSGTAGVYWMNVLRGNERLRQTPGGTGRSCHAIQQWVWELYRVRSFNELIGRGFGITALVAWMVYLATLAPDVTLENSGGLLTGAAYAGCRTTLAFPFGRSIRGFLSTSCPSPIWRGAWPLARQSRPLRLRSRGLGWSHVEAACFLKTHRHLRGGTRPNKVLCASFAVSSPEWRLA